MEYIVELRDGNKVVKMKNPELGAYEELVLDIFSSNDVATLVSGTSLSTPIDMRSFMSMSLITESWTAGNIGLYMAQTESGQYNPVIDEDGAYVEISGYITGSWASFPIVPSFPISYVKLWSKNTASAASVVQAATRTFRIIKK